MNTISKHNKFFYYELGCLDPPPEALADPNHSWWSEARTAASDARDFPNARVPPAGPALDRRRPPRMLLCYSTQLPPHPTRDTPTPPLRDIPPFQQRKSDRRKPRPAEGRARARSGAASPLHPA